MKENEQNLNNNGPWWKPAVQLFSEVSTWIVVPIILALIAGKALDAHYGTKPTIFLFLSAFGFLVSSFGIVKVVRDYMKKLKKSEKKDQTNN